MKNREIKFRAWDIKGKFYKYPKLWDISMSSNWEVHYVLEQLTGLKDKNGVDIYEGDILKWDEGQKGHIVYEINACQFRIKISNDASAHIGLNTAGRGTAIVIGNINENHELLNG